jgi:hypothetical protein
MMTRYAKDPRWLTARWDGTDANGRAFKKGERIFYYPNGRSTLSGEAAEQAARDFEAEAQDEEQLR